jgi:hypothetical protein
MSFDLQYKELGHKEKRDRMNECTFENIESNTVI